MINKFLKLTITLFFTFAINFSANAEIKVVASIKPIHSLASYLMDGVGKPDLIVDGYNSPHGFALKPSHAKMLQNADLVFWVGEDLETFLEKPLKSVAKKAEKIELMEIKGLKKLEFRERNIFEGHDDHGHDDHKEHGHKEINMMITKNTVIKKINMMIIKNTVIKKINMMIIKNTVIKRINTMIITSMLTVNMIHIFGLIQ